MSQISNAVAVQEAASPSAMVERYRGDFAQVLPSHVKLDTWVRLAVGALRRNEDLAKAAANSPVSLMSALLHAARLGLEPGTEAYHLTVRKSKERGPEVVGIPGYQGLVELMYRAGAVSSVIVECVYTHDKFDYVPGRDERPVHEIDWDAENRGALRLAYAYAVMKDGATSKVVVLNRADIEKIKQSATGTESRYSPWKTNEPSMWMKSAARQLAKWVPTSAEYLREQLRAAKEVAQEVPSPTVAAAMPLDSMGLDESTGEVGPEYVEAEVMDEPPGWPA
jgi:recombination protein RecT